MSDFCLEKWKDYKLFILALLAASIVGIGFLYFQSDKKTDETGLVDIEQIANQALDTGKEEITNKEEPQATIVVDIKGAVVKQGVYELSSDKRVHDLIELAGGFLPEADPKSVNLAQKLSDEAVIYVGYQGENSNPLVASNDLDSTTSTGKVNLNKASLSELQTISGIGLKKAQDIIAFREEHGRFKQLDELKQISGIGDKTFEKIQGELTLD